MRAAPGATRTLDLRRHGARDQMADKLSAEGRAQAEALGAALPKYDVVFTSPKQRAAETLALLIAGAGGEVPPHAVIDPLAGPAPQMAGALSALFEHIPDGGTALAVSHTPIIEEATETLTGVRVKSLKECEGVRIIRDGEGRYRVEELRLTDV